MKKRYRIMKWKGGLYHFCKVKTNLKIVILLVLLGFNFILMTSCAGKIPKKEDIVPITERKNVTPSDLSELESPFNGEMTEEESEKVKIGKKYDKKPIREIVDKKNAEVMYYYKAYEYIESDKQFIAVPEANQLFYRKNTTNQGSISEIPDKSFVYILDGYYIVEAHYVKNKAGEYEKEIVYESIYTKVKKIKPTTYLYEIVPNVRSDDELKEEFDSYDNTKK